MGPTATHVFLTHPHEDRGQHGVDHERHKQRRPQHNDQRHWKVAHELTNEAWPKRQGQKGSQRRACGRDDGPSHLSHAVARRVERTVPFVHQAVNVLDHHNAVVDEHAQRQHQGEQDHGVERDAQ